MPDLVIRLSAADAALLGTLGASQGLSEEELAVEMILERLRRVQDEAVDVVDLFGDEDEVH